MFGLDTKSLIIGLALGFFGPQIIGKVTGMLGSSK